MSGVTQILALGEKDGKEANAATVYLRSVYMSQAYYLRVTATPPDVWEMLDRSRNPLVGAPRD